MIPHYTGRNRPTTNGGPSGVQRSYASQLKESEALFNSYEHLRGLPRGDAALTMLRKIASLVKPIMRKRGWRVQILAEFLPPESNLLGLNINRGFKICIRLRYHNNPDLFLPLEQVVDTMLHELSHNVWGEHDSNFHRLWDELRDEHETLVRKGYTGEGFLSEGHKLGGGRHGVPPPHEMRRLARASAEKRQAQGALGRGSGQRLGGTPLHLQGGDVRSVIANQVTRRNAIDRGCASGRQDAGRLSQQSADNTFKTKAEEDDANDRAIAQALFELMEQEEERKIRNGTFSAAPTNGGLAWGENHGLYDPAKEQRPSPVSPEHMSEEEQMKWAMRDSMNGAPPNGWSPVSPMTPAAVASSIDRTASAPPPQVQPKPSFADFQARGPQNGKPMSRLVKDVGQTPAAPRQPPTSQPKTEPQQVNHTHLERNTKLQSPVIDISEPFNPDQWTCEVCTCINPMQFLACDACGCERPQAALAGAGSSSSAVSRANTVAATSKPRWAPPKQTQTESMGWNCGRCGAFMEHKWWTCSACWTMKDSS